jgi:hypothetical protein
MKIKNIIIIAINSETGERIRIEDLYWFEENGIHNFNGEGFGKKYFFEVEIQMNTDEEGVVFE